MMEIRAGEEQFDDYLTVVIKGAASRSEAIAACDMVAIEYYADLAHDNPDLFVKRYVTCRARSKQRYEVTVDYSPRMPEPINDAKQP